jgi:hypothetical protein
LIPVLGLLIMEFVLMSPVDKNSGQVEAKNAFEMIGRGTYAREGTIGYTWECQSMPSANPSARHCWTIIPGCDGKSLEVFESTSYARDKTTAYIHGRKISGSDSASFQALNSMYARDKTGGYFGGSRIMGSDGPSFEAPSKIFARDRSNAYCRGKKIEDALRRSFAILGDSPYAKDDSRVYAWNGSEGEAVVLDADPRSFQALAASSYGLDREHAFFMQNQLQEADSQTFELVFPPQRATWTEASYARDRKTVFYHGRILPGAEAPTFRLLNTNYAVDQFSLFCFGKQVPGVDRASFRLLEKEREVRKQWYADAEDKNHYYQVTALGVNRLEKTMGKGK